VGIGSLSIFPNVARYIYSMIRYTLTHERAPLHFSVTHGSCRGGGLHFLSTYSVLFRVSACLENLEMSGNLIAVREMSEILLKVRELSRKKSCQGKVA